MAAGCLLSNAMPPSSPGLYSEVMDRRTKPVGKIMDVFGNVKSPYALVLSHGPCSVKPGEKVFARESRIPATAR